MLEINAAQHKDAQRIAELAKPIWQEHYTPIIGSKQVEYMLKNFQSEKAVQEQIDAGYQYFIANFSSIPCGYFSIQQRNDCLFISKFYLNAQYRGKGLGKKMLEYIHQKAIDFKANQIELTVNKHNPAYLVYLKLGFQKIDDVQFDIGQGYIMDDYLMRKSI